MTYQVRRVADAENENPKSVPNYFRTGKATRALLDQAAKERGMSTAEFVRRAAVQAALDDLPPAAEPTPEPAADVEPVADHS